MAPTDFAAAPRAASPSDDPAGRRGALGARVGRVDPAALARAEAAMRALSGRFTDWMAEELGRLEQARDQLRNGASGDDAWAELQARAHDLKGLGTTYGHPTATRICASLGRLLHDDAGRAQSPLALVDAHVDAVRRTFDGADAARDAATCAALEAEVAAVLASRSGRGAA